MRLSYRLLSATLPLLCLFGAVPLGADDDFEARRAAALARPREVVINSDGTDTNRFPPDRPATPELFYAAKLAKMKHGVVDTVSYCMFFDARALFPSRFMPLYDCVSPRVKTKNGIRELLEQGTDPVKLAEAYCRRENLEFFLSFRMNDTHDATWRPDGAPAQNFMMSPYKLERFHLLHGSWDAPPPYSRWSAWDYAQSDVRQMMCDIVAEAVDYVHPDGVEYDFMRHAQLFKSVAQGKHATQQECDIMTDFMRKLRAITEAAGRRQNRPVLVAVRVPDSLEYCQKLGIDLEAWMREKLIDIMIGGAYFQLQPWSESVALAHRYGVKFYPSLGSESRVMRRKKALFIKGRNTPEYHAATALAAWEQGVDGLYFFNSDYAAPDAFKRNVDLRRDKVRFADKDYFATERGGAAGPDTYLAGGRAFSRMLELDPCTPAMLTPGKPFPFTIFVGDDLAQADAEGRKASVSAVLRSQDADKAQFSLAVNGCDCGRPERKDDILTFTVPPGALKKGNNEFSIRVQEDAALPKVRRIMRGDRLLAGKTQHPWRCIFLTDDPAAAETVVTDADGTKALRIADDEASAGHAAGFLYPLHNGDDLPLQVYFTMKLESADTPGAVAVRLATGKYVEVVEFMPDSIRFRYANRSVEFNTADAFHSYRFRYDPKSNRFTLLEDRKALLTAAPNASTASLKAQIGEASQQVTGMHENSFYFGSLSGRGRGAALWKNIRLVVPFAHLNDFVLKIRYDHPNPINPQ